MNFCQSVNCLVFLQKQDYHPSDAVLDAGAQSFVCGLNTLYQYSDHLKSQGISWTPKMLTCDRTFRFGNDQTEECKTACVVPVNFAGRTGHLCVYALPGCTPFLFPRPLMEKFG